MRRPTYSSSVPANASGTIGAPVRSAISAAPMAERADPTRRAAHGALRHLDEDRAVARHGAGRRHVAVDADAAAPDRQQPADAVDQPLAPAGGERRRRAAQEPAPRLLGQGVHHHERVHPAPVRRPDQQVAAGPRQELPAGRVDVEPEQAEDHEPGDEPQEPVQQRGPGLGLAAEPRQALGAAVLARLRQGLRGEPRWRRAGVAPASRARRQAGRSPGSSPAPAASPGSSCPSPRPGSSAAGSPSASCVPGPPSASPASSVSAAPSSSARRLVVGFGYVVVSGLVVVLGLGLVVLGLVVLDPLLVVEELVLGRRRVAPPLDRRSRPVPPGEHDRATGRSR